MVSTAMLMRITTTTTMTYSCNKDVKHRRRPEELLEDWVEDDGV